MVPKQNVCYCASQETQEWSVHNRARRWKRAAAVPRFSVSRLPLWRLKTSSLHGKGFNASASTSVGMMWAAKSKTSSSVRNRSLVEWELVSSILIACYCLAECYASKGGNGHLGPSYRGSTWDTSLELAQLQALQPCHTRPIINIWILLRSW